MKIVIVGGGIAGLTLGIFLSKKNHEVVINERTPGMPVRGHAFLMHTDGLKVLNEIAGDRKQEVIGKKVDAFCLKRPDGEEIKQLQLNSWLCIKRKELITYLYEQIPEGVIRLGREFGRFIYEDGRIVAAEFLNGDIEYGDIFVGADGGNSKVRDNVFGKVKFSPVQVKEVVGVSRNPRLAENHKSIFTKVQSKKSGLAFGYIPATDSEFVWFMQYDPSISDMVNNTPEEIRSFCRKLLKKFPADVNEIMDTNNFESTYVWNTRDFDLLPSFHLKNVVLIGDAAHLALPFTSAGTTNAILDARVLADNIAAYEDYEVAFTNYYLQRAADLKDHVALGRDLKYLFLHPGEREDDDIPVPLIEHTVDNVAEAKNKEIQIRYFTDPICSTCWVMQPFLRKLEIEYGRYINIEYHMGGMLQSWETYPKGKIKQPLDAARHWDEVALSYEMPLDGDVWIEDPLNSSYPPSIAFKAAQMQHRHKAKSFLRKMQEMVFIEKKNIIKWEHLEKAAFELGLDSARLLKDFEQKAKDRFNEDLQLGTIEGVTTFPTLLFTKNDESRIVLKGYQSYERFEQVITRLIPDAKKDNINTDPAHLFTLFPTMTTKEFAFLSNCEREEALETLNALYLAGDIGKYESKNGVIWKSRYKNL